MIPIRTFFLLTLTLAGSVASAQICPDDDRYSNAEYFSITEIDSLKDVTYATATDFKGESVDLQMDIYLPDSDADALAKRPFILFMHGGGWHGGWREGYADRCREFAKRGFVAATMSYR